MSNVHSSERISVVMNNVPLADAKGITYKGTQSSQVIRTLGRKKPKAVITHSKEYEGTLTLLLDEYDRLMDGLSAGNDLMDSTGITILHTREDATGRLRTNRLTGVSIMELEHANMAGEVNDEIALPLAITGIDYNI